MTNIPPPDLGGFNLWDWAGAALGTFTSIVYSRPVSKTDFFSRVIVSLVVGGTFGFVATQSFGWPDTSRYSFASGAGMAFFSYAVIGVGFRIVKGIDKLPK